MRDVITIFVRVINHACGERRIDQVIIIQIAVLKVRWLFAMDIIRGLKEEKVMFVCMFVVHRYIIAIPCGLFQK